jgi:hypothetical protein
MRQATIREATIRNARIPPTIPPTVLLTGGIGAMDGVGDGAPLSRINIEEDVSELEQTLKVEE